MTELGGASHSIPPDGKMIPGSVGVLLPNLQCKVLTPYFRNNGRFER